MKKGSLSKLSNFILHHNNLKHPGLKNHKLNFSQRAADALTSFCGSWTFIISLFILMIIWMILNVIIFFKFHWDPYPFILLNFVLSCLAAIQAPIILMSQNREAERDRSRAKYDYQINRKAEREIQEIQKSLSSIKNFLKKKR